MPIAPLLDSHVHFWNPRKTPRAVSPLVRLLGFSPGLVDWAARRLFPRDARDFFGSPVYVTRPYMPATYAEDSGGEVSGVVHIEAGWEGDAVAESRWLEEIAQDAPVPIVAIVARADLSLGTEVAGVLQRHIDASPRVRGVRDMLTWHRAPGVLNGAKRDGQTREIEWRKGFEQLARFNLHFEATCYADQLDDIAELASEHPDQRIVLSHVGTPVAVAGRFGGVKEGASTESWREGMQRLAACPNVFLKISGLAMPVCGFGFEKRKQLPTPDEITERFEPYTNFAIDTFGPSRCMYGSNFPVDKVSMSLATWQQAFNRIIASQTTETQEQLRSGTATRVYLPTGKTV